MSFKFIPAWLVVAAIGAVVVYGYGRFAEDVVGAGFMALFFVIVVVRMMRSGAPVSQALVNATDYSAHFTVHGGIIHYTDPDGTVDWHDATGNFKGVLWRIEGPVRGDRGDRHALELVHDKNPNRTVALYRSESDHGLRARWIAAAREFQLPALRDDGNGVLVSRAPADLEKSLRALIQEGRMVDAFDRAETVPPGITWFHGDGRLSVSIHTLRWPFLLGFLPILFLSAMLPPEPALAKLLLTGVPAVFGLGWMMLDYRIVIDGRGLTVGRAVLGLPLPARQRPVDQFMEVRLNEGLVSVVQVEAGEKTIKISPLDSVAAGWLQRFLMSALAHAPVKDR